MFNVKQLNLISNLYFQISSNQNISINIDLFPKNNNGYFAAYLGDM